MSFVDNESVEVGTIVSGGVALEAATRGEIDIQISTARAYPRSITAFKRTALELATLDADTAGSMFYTLPRGGKKIEGPSVRLAEVIAYAWGNLRAQARIASVDDTFLSAIGTAMDLERNTAAQHEVKRRITDSKGRRFNDDMIAVTANAACSIAFREAVFKIVPRALFKDVYEAARLASTGEGKSMADRRASSLGWFKRQGVGEARVLELLERRGVDDITVDDLITLRGIKTALTDGDLTIDQAFPVGGAAGPSTQATDASARLRQAAAARTSAPPATDSTDPTLPDLEPRRSRRAAAAPPAEAPGAEPSTPAPAPAPAAPQRPDVPEVLAGWFAIAADMAQDDGRPRAGGEERDRLHAIVDALRDQLGLNVPEIRDLARAPRLSAHQMGILLRRWEEIAPGLGLAEVAAPRAAAAPDAPPPPPPPADMDLF